MLGNIGKPSQGTMLWICSSPSGFPGIEKLATAVLRDHLFVSELVALTDWSVIHATNADRADVFRVAFHDFLAN